MPEISLNILDVAENSTRAGASLVTINVTADTDADRLTIQIGDNGCGMSEEQLSHVTDPFYTTRTTRKVGLGVPYTHLDVYKRQVKPCLIKHSAGRKHPVSGGKNHKIPLPCHLKHTFIRLFSSHKYNAHNIKHLCCTDHLGIAQSCQQYGMIL